MNTPRSDSMYLAGYYLARCGDRRTKPARWPAALEVNSWNEAYDVFFEVAGDGRPPETFRGSLVQVRNTFDILFPNGRQGWKGVGQKESEFKGVEYEKIHEKWKSRSDEELEKEIFNLLNKSDSSDAKSEHDAKQARTEEDEIVADPNENQFSKKLYRKRMHEFAKTLQHGQIFRPGNLYGWLEKHARNINRDTVRSILYEVTVNSSVRLKRPQVRPNGEWDLFVRLSHGKYSLWDGKNPPTPLYDPVHNEYVVKGDREEVRTEGGEKVVVSKQRERNWRLREEAVEKHGDTCMGCSFNFEKFYGKIGRGFIEVHHVVPLADYDGERATDPEKDLVVLCANCHRMVHKNDENGICLSLDELKRHIKGQVSAKEQ